MIHARIPATVLALALSATAHANNERRVTPEDPLFIEFRVEPGVTGVPDTFVVFLGQTEALEPGTGQRITSFDNQGRGLGGHVTTAFGDVVGAIDMDPGATFISDGSPYTTLEPGVLEIGSFDDLALGTEGGLIRLSISTGALVVDLDDIRIEWGQATGPDTYTASDVQPEITAMYVGSPCYADFDRSGELDVFDFLAYTNAFQAGNYRADCDGCGSLDIFDFLCFVSMFNEGCP